MTIEQLRSAHQARPFVPFTFHMADGERLGVPHQDFLSTSPSGRTIIVYEKDDSWHVVDLLLVARLEFGKAKSAKKNGRSH